MTDALLAKLFRNLSQSYEALAKELEGVPAPKTGTSRPGKQGKTGNPREIPPDESFWQEHAEDKWVPACTSERGNPLQKVRIHGLIVTRDAQFHWSDGALFKTVKEDSGAFRTRGTDHSRTVRKLVVLAYTFHGAPPSRQHKAVLLNSSGPLHADNVGWVL